MITPKQLNALMFLIDRAKVHAWCIPTAEELAAYLNGPNIGHSSIRSASALIQRLADNYKIFMKRPGHNRWFVNTKSFVTETTTAVYIMRLHSMCNLPQNPHRSVSKDDVHNALLHENGFDPQVLERIFVYAKRAGYVDEVANVAGKPLRIGHATSDQLPWIKHLAGII